jgi:hypothetical protein
MALKSLTEDRVDRAMHTLAETDAEVADSKVAVMRSEMKAKSIEALIYASLTGSIEDRKQAVRLDQRFEKAWEDHFTAVAHHEKLKNFREREVLVIELYRSVLSARKAGMTI